MDGENVGGIQYDARITTANLKKDAGEAEAIAGKAAKNIGDESEKGAERASTAYTLMAKAVKIAAVAGAAALATGFIASIKSAGSFESSLSQLAYNANASGDELAKLTATARALGKDTDLAGVTASKAADAMNELAKAGLSNKDIMDATKSVLSLAKAGNIEYAEAATIAASALNAFNLEGKDASKVADALAAGANASQADLTDLAQGMQQSATVAKQFKLSINDNVTALALFANNGIKGSDAGTSLKTMLIALAKPSAGAASTMKDLGFSAYNAQGEFVGLREMSARLQKSLKGLTDEQKQSALATIFGTDAFRAAAILSDNAGDSYDKMSKAVGKVGAAQKAAASSQGAYQKSIENLQNTLSDIGLDIGNETLPTITRLIESLSRGLGPAFRGAKDAANATYQTVQAGLPIFAGVGAGLVAYNTIMLTTTAATKAMAAAQLLLNNAMKLSPIGLVTSAVIGVTAAYLAASAEADRDASASERLRVVRENLARSTDIARDAENRMKNAMLDAEGAALRVESAQRAHTDAVSQFGPGSLEARQAAYDLKRAQDDLANANANARDRTNENAEAQKNLGKAKDEAVKANRESAASADGAAGSYRNFKNSINEVNDALIKGGGNKKTGEAFNNLFNIPKRAAGGPVSAGQPYIVGDNRDGSLNSTSELFVPKTSGSIVNSKDLQAALRGSGVVGGSGSSLPPITNNFYITNQLDMEVASRRFAYMLSGARP